MINILFEEFRNYVEIDGVKYHIITDFREWIRMSTLIDSDLDDKSKVILMLGWYKDKVPPDIKKAIDGLGDFLAAYELYEEKDRTKSEKKNDEILFDFSIDSADIYSSFLSCYHIDLRNIDYMHWFQFRILFDTLPSECSIKRKIYYRALNENSIRNREERARIREIKNSIRITKKRNTELSDYDIGDVFS